MKTETSAKKKTGGQPPAARSVCLSILEYRDRSEYVLKNKLREKGFSEEDVIDAVEYARSFGYVDDRRYADNFIRINCSNKSPRQMGAKLKEQGVDQEIIEETLSRYADEESAALSAFLAKKAKALGVTGPSDDDDLYGHCSTENMLKRRKLISAALGRGFSYQAVKDVLRKMDLTD